MILDMFGRLRKAGVLGMNSRNADYIMRWNPRSNYPIVDNKLLTKELAKKHQIPTPHLYFVVEHHGNIAGLEEALGGRSEFVVKPARGTGGSGIVLVKDCTAEGFVTQSGEVISRGDFAYHISEILSGVYSLEGLEDRAIIEALIYPDPVFAAVTFQGVPDVRIVVYRGVPAMAMVRLPTRASDGKANLHRGAIGAGIGPEQRNDLNRRSSFAGCYPPPGHWQPRRGHPGAPLGPDTTHGRTEPGHDRTGVCGGGPGA